MDKFLEMYFSVLFFLILASLSSASDSYTCPTDRQCISLRNCHHEGATIWCNDERTKVCCPKRSSGENYISEKIYSDKSYSIPKYDGGESYKSEKSYSQQPKYDSGDSYSKTKYDSGDSYSKTKYDSGDSYSKTKYDSGDSYSKTKYDGGDSYSKTKYDSGAKYDSGDSYKSDQSYSGSKYDKSYRGLREYYDLDYYEDGYAGPGLSREAKRILQSYDERECGVRRSFYGRVSTGHEVDLGITKYGEFPWQAAILLKISDFEGSGRKKAYKFLCGATVVNPVLILTAAHCIKGMRISNLKVKLGEWNLRGTQGEMFPTVDRRIRNVIVHNYYNSATFEHDIALLVLSKPVNLRKTPHVAPACIPPKHTKFDEYSKCYITGWGNDIYKPNYGSNILKVASVSLLKDDCRHKLKESIPSLSNNFFSKTDLRCVTGSFGKDACVGDGGGAVVCPLSNSEVSVCKGGYSCKDEHYFIAGIVSWGSDKCGQDDSVTVVTDFDSHRDWIAEKARPYGGIDSYHDYDYDSYYRQDSYGSSDSYGYGGPDSYGYGSSDSYGRYGDRYDGYDGYDSYDRHGSGYDRYDGYGRNDGYDGYDSYDGYGRNNRYDGYGSYDSYDGYDRYDSYDGYGRNDRYDSYDSTDRYDRYDYDRSGHYDDYDHKDRYYRGGKRGDGYSYESYDSPSHDYSRHEFEKYVR